MKIFKLFKPPTATLNFSAATFFNPHPPHTCRLRNQALYFASGCKELPKENPKIKNVIELEVDGVNIPLNSLKGLVFLNIETWGGGSKPWGSAASRRFQVPRINDGLLEVFGLDSIWHMVGVRSAFITFISFF